MTKMSIDEALSLAQDHFRGGQFDAADAVAAMVVEAAPASEVDCARIASAIAAALRVPSVRVRAHRGLEEARALFRLLSTGERRGVSPGGGVDS